MDHYYHIHEVKDFSFKSSIYEKSVVEVKKGTEVFIEQLKKMIARYRKKGKNGGQAESAEPQNLSINSDRTVVREYKKTITSLKS